MKLQKVFAVLLLSVTVQAGAALGPVSTAAGTEPLFTASIKQGDLVCLQGKSIKRYETSLVPVRYIALLYSDSANAACQGVIPGLVDYYNETKPSNPHFELIMVPRDASQVTLEKAMKKYEIKFPVVAFSHVRSHKTLNKFASPGVPDLVLIDAHGKVLSTCYRDGKFVGISFVMDDIKKALKQDPATKEDIEAANKAAQKSGPGASKGGSSFDDLFKKH